MTHRTLWLKVLNPSLRIVDASAAGTIDPESVTGWCYETDAAWTAGTPPGLTSRQRARPAGHRAAGRGLIDTGEGMP